PLPAPDLRSLALVLAGTFVLRCASYAAGIIIVVSLGLKSRTDSEVTAGLASLIAVTFYAAELIGAPIFGSLTDRFGRRPFMLLGPVFGGVAIEMLGWVSVIPILVLVRVLEGLSTASSAPAILGYLSAQTAGSERLRGRVMGLYEAATVVGLASGAALGGRLYEQYGRWAFSMIALVYLVSLALFWWARDFRTPASVASHHPRDLFKRMFNPRIMRFAPAWLAANAVLGAWFNLGPFLASGVSNPQQELMGGFSPGRIGLAFMAFAVIFTLGAVGWGFVLPRIGRQASLMWGVRGLVLTTFGVWLVNEASLPSSPVIDAGFLAVLTTGVFIMSGFTPAALAYLAEIAEEQAHDRGSVMGVYSVLLAVGHLLGGALAAPFAGVWGVNGLILLTGILSMVAFVTVALLGRSEQRFQKAAQQPQRPDTAPAG
ncbi:MAG: MFS transporter, partial [Chloroflexi bacterium]|nr:MFS transporter [Chloroflexota bacterium]